MKLAEWKQALEGLNLATGVHGPVFQSRYVGQKLEKDIALGALVDGFRKNYTPKPLYDLCEELGLDQEEHGHDLRVTMDRDHFRGTLEFKLILYESGMSQHLQPLRVNFGARGIEKSQWTVRIVARRPVGSQCTALVGLPVDLELLRDKLPTAVFHDAIQFRAWPESSWIEDIQHKDGRMWGRLRTDQYGGDFSTDMTNGGDSWSVAIPPYPGASLSLNVSDLELL
jgi:hypothetical protein